MASYQTEAVVIGSRNWGEADKMVSLFTKERGVIKAAAFGCRRPRSPLASSMQMFSWLEVQLTEGQRVDTVRQCTLKQHYRKLTEDLSAMAYASFVAEFLQEFLPEGQSEPHMFDQLIKILAAFDKRNPRVVALMAVYQLFEYTGMQLHFENCVQCGAKIDAAASLSFNAGGVLCPKCQVQGQQPLPNEVRQLIIALRDYDWDRNLPLHINAKALLVAENILLQHLQILLGHNLKSLEFIRALG